MKKSQVIQAAGGHGAHALRGAHSHVSLLPLVRMVDGAFVHSLTHPPNQPPTPLLPYSPTPLLPSWAALARPERAHHSRRPCLGGGAHGAAAGECRWPSGRMDAMHCKERPTVLAPAEYRRERVDRPEQVGGVALSGCAL